MAITKINMLGNGPLKIEGDFSIADPNGNPVDCKSTVFLCRCGASSKKPFCDGAHKSNGFCD